MPSKFVSIHFSSINSLHVAQFEQHIDRNFIADFIKTTRSETGKPNLFALGEFWKDSFDDLSNYVNALGTQVRFVASSAVLMKNAYFERLVQSV